MQTLKQRQSEMDRAEELGKHLDDEVKIKRLAAMSPLQYGKVRKAEASKLGVKVATLDKEINKIRNAGKPVSGESMQLDDPEPWPHSVDGAALLFEIVSILKRYLVLVDHAAETIALWILFTYAFDAMQISPNLAMTSPQKRCGKTTLMSILMLLCKRAMPASNISPASLFRTTEKWQPTLLIDEADTFLKTNEELQGILNSGHTKNMAYVIRTVGDDHEPKQFSTWAPKAIAAIGKLKDTLIDRSILIPMRRKTTGEKVTRLKGFDGADLRRRCERWAMDNMESIRTATPFIPPELHDRAADNWEPLLAIADIVDGGWSEMARKAARAFSNIDDGDDSIGVLLLQDIEAIFSKLQIKRIRTAHLIDELHKIDDRPWKEWKMGKPMSDVQLSRLLKPFGIKPATLTFAPNTLYKGYALESFKDAFTRYRAVSPLVDNENKELNENRPVMDKNGITGQNSDNSLNYKETYDLTGQNTEWGDTL